MGVAQRHNVRQSGPVDAPVLLFAHGFGCDQHMWRYVAPRFADRFRVVLFDLAGAGDASPEAYDPERHARLEGYAEDVVALCHDLELHDVTFVGHSVSSMIGALAAAAEPGLFRRLVMVCPSPRYLDDEGYVGGFTASDIDELLASLDSNYLGWSSAMAPVIVGNPDRPELGEELTESFCRVDPAIASRFARATFLADNRADLARVATPTLVLQCSDDAIAPVAVGEHVRDALPHSSYVLLDATGHCPQLSEPDATAEAIADFLAPVSGERALEAFYAALLADDAEDLYERAPCGYLSTTPDGLITKVNQTFLTLTGFEREQLVGQRTFASLLTAGGRIYHETHYAPLLRMEGAARAIALEVVRADGQRLPVLVNAMLDRDADGAPAVIRAAVFDATDRRRYEQELLAAKQRAEASESRAMALASTLQQTLIPPAPPVVPGLDVAAAYRPAGRGDEVGGDFYDVFEVADGDWVVVVGDVCGKGAAAAIVTAAARYALRAAAIHEPKPSAVLALLDEVLAADGSDRYCTVALTRLHRTGTGWVATTCSGGHPLPVLLAAGRPPRVVGQPGALVGVFTNVTRVDVEVPLAPGDVLAFVTDGVTEGRRGRDFYGDDRLLAALADQPTAQAAVDHLLAEVLAFQDDLPRDDIVVVALGPPA